jgi:hypothetical protein
MVHRQIKAQRTKQDVLVVQDLLLEQLKLLLGGM